MAHVRLAAVLGAAAMLAAGCADRNIGAGGAAKAPRGIDQLQKDFQTPPEDARIMVRFWWFGPAVTREGIERELRTMKAGGIGGVEVQPTYPLAVDGGTGDGAIKNLKFMSPEFLEMLTFTAGKCKELGLRMDLTLGSGWPYGGPEFSLEESAGALQAMAVQVAAGQTTARPGNLRAGQAVFAAFAGPRGVGAALPGAGGGRGRGGRGAGGAAGADAAATEPVGGGEAGGTGVDAGGAGDAGGGAGAAAGGPGAGRGAPGRGGARGPSVVDLSKLKEVPVKEGVAQLPEGFTGDVIFFISGHAGASGTVPVMQVKRPALGAEGNVMDHLSAAVVDKFIREIAEPEIKACAAGGNPPHAIFCDSLEVAGENWTPEFLAEFQKRRGYDLRPYLPALIGNIGERTEDVRYDYGRTLTEVFDDNFNGQLTKLARRYGSRFRIQGYGSPPAGLMSYAYADLPEGEAGGNGNWRTFRATRYAASASHLMGQKVTSSETFTWLHQAPFRATPLDMKGEVDTHFLDGINQVICHGWPYTGNGATYPGWSFYAGGVFDEKNPWWAAMPEVTGYMQRVSAMLREGAPANDVALYLPDSDVWSRAWTGYSSMNAAYTGLNGMVAQIVDRGYNLDGWDDGMLALKGKVEGGRLAFGEQKYRIVVLANVERMPLETARKMEEFAKGGGMLYAVGRTPTRVPGMKTTAEEQKELAGIMQRLFKDAGAPGILVGAENQFGETLAKKVMPDIGIDPVVTAIGGVHRRVGGDDVYFLANTGNQKQSVKVTFRVEGMEPELWDPLTGKVGAVTIAGKKAGGTTLALDFDPLGSALVVWTKRKLPAAAVAGAAPAAMDLSGGWSVKFGDTGKTVQMEKLASWTTLEGLQNFSGVATYERKVSVAKEAVAARWMLSLGESTPMAAAGGGRGAQGYAAQVTPPVYDAAVVYVNGVRAGAAWCPPYQVDVSGLLKEGENAIRIDVGNTAMNYLVKAGFPNYDNAAVRRAYGNRFDPQGLQLYSQLLPSGLAGPIRLEAH